MRVLECPMLGLEGTVPILCAHSIIGAAHGSSPRASGKHLSRNAAASWPSAFSGRPTNLTLLCLLLHSKSSTLSVRVFTVFSSVLTLVNSSSMLSSASEIHCSACAMLPVHSCTCFFISVIVSYTTSILL